jgi:hypothetical protein
LTNGNGKLLIQKYSNIYIAVLNNANLFDEISIASFDDYVILLSTIDLSNISSEGINKLLSIRYPIIPSIENYRYIKTADTPRLYGWAMSQPREVKALTRNGALIWANGKTELNWHIGYQGREGYAVAASTSLTQQYAYSIIIANPSKKLIFWRFDGIRFLEVMDE